MSAAPDLARDRLDLELELVAAILADVDALAASGVRLEDLRGPEAGAIFEAIVELGDAARAEGGVCDMAAIRDYIAERPRMKAIVGESRAKVGTVLADLCDLPQLETPEAIGRRIREHALRDALRDASARASGGDDSALDEAVRLRDEIQALETGTSSAVDFEPLARIEPAPLAPFPTNALGSLAPFVEALCASAQVPPELAGPAALGFAGGAVARKAIVDTGSWLEELCFYVGVVACPGTRKSPVWSACSTPVETVEAELLADGAADREAAGVRDGLLMRRLAGVAGRFAKACPEDREALEAEAIEIQKEQRQAEEDARPRRLLASDCTPERLASLMHQNGERLILASAEGAVVFDRLGRYSANGEPSLDLLLSAWCGEPVRVDRQSGEPIAMHRPCLTVVAALQPDVLRTLGRQPSFVGRGLLDRFCWSIPPDRRGFRDVRASQPMNRATQADYHRLVRRLLEIPAGDEPMVLEIEGDAREAFLDTAQGFEDLQREGEELADIPGWASKAAGLVARLAGLLALVRAVDEGRPAAIDRATVEDATRLGLYFADHARRAFELLDGRTGDAAVDKLVRWLKRRAEPRADLTRRDAWRGTRGGRFAVAADLEAPLRRLEAAGWIARQPEAARRPGRPSERWRVNPEAPLHGE